MQLSRSHRWKTLKQIQFNIYPTGHAFRVSFCSILHPFFLPSNFLFTLLFSYFMHSLGLLEIFSGSREDAKSKRIATVQVNIQSGDVTENAGNRTIGTRQVQAALRTGWNVESRLEVTQDGPQEGRIGNRGRGGQDVSPRKMPRSAYFLFKGRCFSS